MAVFVACATAFPAQAVGVDEGTWDYSTVYAECGTGFNSWTCRYQLWSADCAELAVNTGAGTGVSITCSAYVDAYATAYPRVNAAGRRVGCTSIGEASGHVSFNSNVLSLYDNASIDTFFLLTVVDGAVEFFCNGD